MNATLVVIDVQVDFCSGGALAVPEADAILPVINALMGAFQRVFLTQDWHPRGHVSFASRHPGRQAFTTLELPYGPQMLWPDHCIAGTSGAELHQGLAIPPHALRVYKGTRPEIDSYSAFYENDRRTRVGLDAALRRDGVTEIILAGLATDFCVLHTAIDGRKLGYEVTVVESACRGIDRDGSLAAAWAQMDAAGVRRA
jgi:nicotinamidase-related amidase